jgi:hypothetical protein
MDEKQDEIFQKLRGEVEKDQSSASSLTATDPRSLVVTGEEHFEDGYLERLSFCE